MRLGTLLANPPFSKIAGDSRLVALTDHESRPPAILTSATITNGEALIAPKNSTWDAAESSVRPRFTFPPIMQTYAFTEGSLEGPLADLQRMVASGRSAGNVGDLYDNRDNGV